MTVTRSLVGEVDIAKLDRTGDSRQACRLRQVMNFRLRAEHMLETDHGSAAALQDRQHPSHGHRRPGQQVEIANEGDEIAEAESPVADLQTTEPQDDEGAQAGGSAHDRHDLPAHTGEFETLLLK